MKQRRALLLSILLFVPFAACQRLGGQSVQLENPPATPTPPIPDAPGKTPDWVPIYPGAAPNTVARNSDDTSTTVNLAFSTDSSIKDVLKFYEKELTKTGFALTKSESTARGVTYHAIVAQDTTNRRMVNLSAFLNHDYKTGVALSYTEKKK
jgi:hypothetical protein